MTRIRSLAIGALLVGIAHASVAQAQQVGNGAEPVRNDASPIDRAQTDPASKDEIVVTGIRQSVRTALAIKRNADQIVDSIVSEDIGKLPDNNAAEALARLTGVQVERSGGEANNVLIRGLNTFVTTVNGREIFTTTGRRVNIQDFPADSLAGIDVYKSTSAELIDGGIAGVVNIRLRRPFDFSKRGLTVSGGARGTYATQSRGFDPIANVLVSDRWDTAIGEMGLLVNGSFTRRHYFDSTRFDSNQIPVGATQTVTPASVGRAFSYSNFLGIYYNRGVRDRPAVNASFQWRPASNLDLYADFLYEGYRNHGDADFIGSYLGNVATLENVTLIPSGETARSLTAQLVNTNGPAKITQIASTDTFQEAIGGTWTLGRLKLTPEFAYTQSNADSSDINIDTNFLTAPRVEVLDFNAEGSVNYRYQNVDLYSPNSYSLANMYDGRSRSRGNSAQVRIDGRYNLDTWLLKRIDFGFRWQDRRANFQQGDRRQGTATTTLFTQLPGASQAQVVQGGFVGSSIQQQRTWLAPSFEQIRNNLAAFRTLIYGSDAPPPFNPLAAYRATETTTTGYGQLAYEVPLGSIRVDGLVGVRYVHTDNSLDGTGRINSVLTPINGRQAYDDFLPNASTRVRFTDKLQFRFAYSKTITRPDFNALNPSIVIASAGTGFELTGSGGNPNLTPTRSSNYDVALEYYLTPTSSVSIAGFYRDITGFVTNFSTLETVNGQNARIYRPYSAGAGTLKGIEASFTTFFTFLPHPFDGFGTQINGTYIEGVESFAVPGVPVTSGEFPGVSRYSYNLIGFYEKGPFSARLAYNWRSRWITNYTSSGGGGGGLQSREYTAPIARLDFSGSFKVTDDITVTADATNLLGEPFQDYYGSPTFPRDVRYEDSVYSLGVRFKF